MANIGDVAKRAGVSRSTVCYALSGNRPISAETRDRIAKAIRELGYTANAGARALATSKSWIMGLIVPFTPEEFAPATLQYVLSASETARSLGYDVLMVNGQEGDAGIARITESGLVDGVIVLDVRRHDDRIEALERTQQPSVLVGMPDDVVPIDSVDLDFHQAGRKLVRHLHERGHRSILFLPLPDQVFTLDLGYAWRFREAVLGLAGELGMAVRIIPGDADPEVRARSIGTALDANTDATAMLVHNDGALADLPMLFLERGLSIPQDLSVVSLFPERFGRMFSLPYTRDRDVRDGGDGGDGACGQPARRPHHRPGPEADPRTVRPGDHRSRELQNNLRSCSAFSDQHDDRRQCEGHRPQPVRLRNRLGRHAQVSDMYAGTANSSGANQTATF